MTRWKQKTSVTAALALLFEVALLSACDHAERTAEERTQSPAVEVEEIDDDVERFAGKQVDVVGEVDTTYSARAFELDGLDWLFADEVLVLAKNPMMVGQRTFDTDDVLRVSGTVQNFSKAKLESNLGWRFEPAFEEEWSDRPVILASNIELIRSYAAWSDEDHSAGILTSPWDDEWNGKDLEAAHVDIASVRINHVGKKALWIGPDQPGTLVIPEHPEVLMALEKSDRVRVQGIVRGLGDDRDLPIKTMSGEQKRQLETAGIYIQATKLTKAQPEEGEQG